jgi:eukaryotic-like serine/threonine-protein kinase
VTSFRERFEWLLRIGLLVFVLAAAAFLSAVMAMRFAIQGREVTLPNLVGKNASDVQTLVQGRGLQLKIADRVYSDLPANVVVRQSPPSGEHMKVSQDVHVVLSLGPQKVTVPALVGENVRIARIQLLQSGLQLGEVTAIPVADLSADTIVQQSPAPGSRAASLRVNLLITAPNVAPSYVMPWLVGMQLPDAERLASSGELKFTKITYAEAPQWPKGTITAQIPDAGSKISAELPLEIIVAQ